MWNATTRPTPFISIITLSRCVAQSEGVTVDLAGETIGVRSDALVNAPMEPRLFVYRRDGSALELLRNEDAQEWCERLSHLSPSQPQRHRMGDGAGRLSAGGVTSGVDVMEHECCSDPHSQGARQVNGCPEVAQAQCIHCFKSICRC